MTVRFHAENGVTLAAMALGAPVPGDPRRRRFRVRRPDTFARWVLGFAGDATVEEPAALAARVRELAGAALATYGVAR